MEIIFANLNDVVFLLIHNITFFSIIFLDLKKIKIFLMAYRFHINSIGIESCSHVFCDTDNFAFQILHLPRAK